MNKISVIFLILLSFISFGVKSSCVAIDTSRLNHDADYFEMFINPDNDNFTNEIEYFTSQRSKSKILYFDDDNNNSINNGDSFSLNIDNLRISSISPIFSLSENEFFNFTWGMDVDLSLSGTVDSNGNLIYNNFSTMNFDVYSFINGTRIDNAMTLSLFEDNSDDQFNLRFNMLNVDEVFKIKDSMYMPINQQPIILDAITEYRVSNIKYKSHEVCDSYNCSNFYSFVNLGSIDFKPIIPEVHDVPIKHEGIIFGFALLFLLRKRIF